MINSMTGYGEAEGQFSGITYAVEIKALNGRYFKARVKLPDTIAYLETDIEQLLRKNLVRGMIDCTLELKNITADVLFNIDEKSLLVYIDKLSRVSSSAKAPCHIDLSGLLNLPGVIQPVSPDKQKAEQLKGIILKITEKALQRLKQMRTAEGAALAADLMGYCDVMKKNIDLIKARVGTALQEYQKKLKKRVDELLIEAKLNLNEEVLAREVAVYADRSDISEELTRLESHLDQFADSCRTDGHAAGRRLDFLTQEMLREANTIASKASDTEIIHLVVDMKCQIERIKEQVQNVE